MGFFIDFFIFIFSPKKNNFNFFKRCDLIEGGVLFRAAAEPTLSCVSVTSVSEKTEHVASCHALTAWFGCPYFVLMLPAMAVRQVGHSEASSLLSSLVIAATNTDWYRLRTVHSSLFSLRLCLISVCVCE